ncbi:MAG: hypothetical protein CFH10_00291 [Alphaproteobacteria bacterium MarineAlpha4_Bin2]|nr:MAG: hypothetical protein CFH10_00291 [Alphaproteobacteria bacterium MarineAlpha4_Bin2]
MKPARYDKFTNQRQAATPGCPVVDPAEWTAAEMASSDDWCHHLNDAEIDELRRATTLYDREDIDVMPLGRNDFDLPRLALTLAKIRAELLYGRGFAVVRGLPVDDFGKCAAAIAFWAIGQHLGDAALSQNKHGHVLGHVTDIGESRSNPSQRGPYSRDEIPFHVDCADIVGLLCMEVSKTGGESSLVSSVSVHNEILKRRPDLLETLYQPFYRDRRDEVPPSMKPWYQLAVFHVHQGYFSASIEPTYISSAHRFDEVPEMTSAQKEAVSMVQSISEELRFDTGFKRGDMQFCNNHVIFHTRRSFEDFDEPTRKRHLLRLWLKAMDGRPLPPAFYERHGKLETIDRPGGILGNNTVLNAPIKRI